jgi:GTP-binding protein
MYEWICYQGFRPVIIATKSDKLSRNQIVKQTSVIKKTLGLKSGDILIPFSAVNKSGRDEIWALMESALKGEEDE